MPSEMFGSPIGTRAYDEDVMQSIKTGTGAYESLMRSAVYPAHARLYNAEAAKKEADAAGDTAADQIARNILQPKVLPEGVAGPPEPGFQGTQADFFDEVANRLSAQGYTEQARKIAKDASLIRQHNQAASSSATTARLNELKIVGERAELMGQLFGGADSPEAWNRANAIFTFQTGQASPYSGVPYSPELAQSLREQATTIKDRLADESRRLTREETERHNRTREAQHDQNLRLRERELDIAREREARQAKAGSGKGTAGSPTTEERAEVRRLMKLDGIEVDKVSSESVNSAAFSIASRAREMQLENRALGRAAAIQRAYAEAQDNGDLNVEVVRRKSVGGFDIPGTGERRFTRGKPMAAPAVTERKVGRKYTLPNGKIGTWREGGWEVQ